MFIQTETLAGGARMKFLPGRSVTGSGTADFADAEAAERSPLAERLFSIDAVAAVSLGPDHVTVGQKLHTRPGSTPNLPY